MDENLHDDIGEFFYNGIEPLRQPVRKQVWDKLEQQLDKKDAAQYKKKVLNTRRLAAVLILSLLLSATCTYMYFNNGEVGKESNHAITRNKKDANSNNDLPANINATDSSLVIKKKTNTKTVTEDFAKSNKTSNDKQENIKLNGFTENQSRTENRTDLLAIRKNQLKYKSVIDIDRSMLLPECAGIKKGSSLNATTNANNLLYNQLQQFVPADSLAQILTSAGDSSELVKIEPQVLPGTLVDNSIANRKTSSKIIMKKPVASRISVMVFAAPENVNYHLQNGVVNPYDNKQLIKNRERPDMSYSTGILLGYDITNHLILQTGISFSSANTNIAPSRIYAEKNTDGSIKYRYNTSSGYGYILPSFTNVINVGDSVDASRADQTIQYINIPLLVKYRSGNKKLSFDGGAGIAFNFLRRAILNTDIIDAQNREQETITQLKGLKNLSYTLILVPELDYSLSKKISLSLLPSFKYTLGPINKGNIVKTYAYNLGLGIGAVYRF